MEKFLRKTRKTTSDCVIAEKNSAKENQGDDSSTCEGSSELLGSLVNVNKLLSLAKLPNTQSEVQQIVVSPTFSLDDYRLMEVSPAIADEIEAGSNQFVFRGQLDDYPVLCTKDKTYLVKEADTSNTLMILSDLHFSNEVSQKAESLTSVKVETVQFKYLELTEMRFVYLSRLKELLHESEIEWTKVGEEPGLSNEDRKLYTFDELLNIIQMSETELRNALERLPIIHYNGFLRSLSSEFRDRVLMELIELMDDDDEPNISIQSVNIQSFYSALKQREPDRLIPLEAVEWIVKNHCHKAVKDGIETFYVNERALCRSKASQLLRAAVRFELSEFEKLMEQLLPEGVEMKDEYLEGLALIDEELARGKTIRYFNVEDLPEDEEERLGLLFSLRERWKFVDIRPFLVDICKTDREVNEMLAKRCRMAVINEERMLIGLK